MSEPWVFLLAVEKPDLVPVVDEALRSASIPCHTGLQLEPSPMVVFTVPASRESEAREAVELALRGDGDEERERKAEEVVSRERATPPARRRAMKAVYRWPRRVITRRRCSMKRMCSTTTPFSFFPMTPS